jgi:hypothetical protein
MLGCGDYAITKLWKGYTEPQVIEYAESYEECLKYISTQKHSIAFDWEIMKFQ